MSRTRTSMPLRLASSAMPPPITPAPASTMRSTRAGWTDASATTASFLARSESWKMRTRFLHTGPVTRCATSSASSASPRSTDCPIEVLEHAQDARRRRVVPAGARPDRRARLAEARARVRTGCGRGTSPWCPSAGARRAASRPGATISSRTRCSAASTSHAAGTARATRPMRSARLRVERAPGEQQVEGAGQADQARQPRGAAEAGQDAEQHLGQSDLGARLLARDPRIARQRQLDAAAQAHAVDGRDRGHPQRREPPVDRVRAAHQGPHLLGVGERGDGVDVGAGDERAALAAAQHHPAHVRVGLDRRQRRLEGGDGGLVDAR